MYEGPDTSTHSFVRWVSNISKLIISSYNTHTFPLSLSPYSNFHAKNLRNMSIKNITSLAEFDSLCKDNARVAVHFWASWCEPCKQMDIVLEQLAKENPTVVFARVEAEEVADVSEKCGVNAVPFFALVSGPKVVATVEGADPLQWTRTLDQHWKKAAPAPAAATPQETKEQTFARIKGVIEGSDVVLFMKGTQEEPRCGFSSKVVKVLRDMGVTFGSFDILKDEAVRSGIKEYSQWPTFPQLYVKGELVGGCDIVLEMNGSGELKDLMKEKGVPTN